MYENLSSICLGFTSKPARIGGIVRAFTPSLAFLLLIEYKEQTAAEMTPRTIPGR